MSEIVLSVHEHFWKISETSLKVTATFLKVSEIVLKISKSSVEIFDNRNINFLLIEQVVNRTDHCIASNQQNGPHLVQLTPAKLNQVPTIRFRGIPVQSCDTCANSSDATVTTHRAVV